MSIILKDTYMHGSGSLGHVWSGETPQGQIHSYVGLEFSQVLY